MNTLMETIKFFITILLELTVLFLGISTLVSLVFRYISQETLGKALSKKGLLGNFLGAALGAVTPFCSCSTIPMTVGLLRVGVPFGATMSFVIASPLLNPIILTMFLAMLGWKATLIYGGITFIAAMLSGAALELLGLQKDVKKVRISGGHQDNDTSLPFLKKLREAFGDAWRDFTGILLFLLLGVAVGAAIYGYLPMDFVIRIAGSGNPFAIPVAAVIGVPLYVRAETVIPITVALTQKSMSIGAVLALIIGGAGMSIPEMSMLAGIFRKRLVIIFIGVVFLTAVIAGFSFNAIVLGGMYV